MGEKFKPQKNVEQLQ